MNEGIDKIIKEMPVVILAGGRGINLGTGGKIIPKPMVEMNGTPIIKYIMKHYADAGFRKFIICLGFDGDLIKKYTAGMPKEWDIKTIETGTNNLTGSRLAQAKALISTPSFCMTYGDTYSDVPLKEELAFHVSHGKTATLLAVHNPTRFRILGLVEDDDIVKGLSEKPILEKDYINGGFYFLNSDIFRSKKLSTSPSCVFEKDVLEDLAAKKELFAFRYNGVWHPVDNSRDQATISTILAKINP
jgi:glucose-1-phosphate cytidylyltransferase